MLVVETTTIAGPEFRIRIRLEQRGRLSDLIHHRHQRHTFGLRKEIRKHVHVHAIDEDLHPAWNDGQFPIDQDANFRSFLHRPAPPIGVYATTARSEEHTSELQSLMRISYAVFCLT